MADPSGRKIDYDRGVRIRTAANVGMDIYMYKDRPGEYLNVHGNPVPKEIAAQAGFETEKLEKRRLHRLARAAAVSRVDQEMELEDTAQRGLVANFGNYRVVQLGDSDRYGVDDADGNAITQGTILTKTMAYAVAEQMARADGSLLPQPSGNGGGDGVAVGGGFNPFQAAPNPAVKEETDADLRPAAEQHIPDRHRPANRGQRSSP